MMFDEAPGRLFKHSFVVVVTFGRCFSLGSEQPVCQSPSREGGGNKCPWLTTEIDKPQLVNERMLVRGGQIASEYFLRALAQTRETA